MLRLLGFAVVAVALSGCGNPLSSSENITYRVTGTAALVSVTYTGQSQRADKVTLPWSITVGVPKNSTLMLIAVIESETGCVTLEISKGGSSRKGPEICGTFKQVVDLTTNN